MVDTPFRQLPYGYPTMKKDGDLASALSDLAKNIALSHNVNTSLLQRIAGAFVVTATDPLSMVVQAWPGAILVNGTMIEKDIQISPTIVAPSSNPRVDRIDLNGTTGDIIYTKGTEAANPTAPPLPSGAYPLAVVSLAPGQQSIAQAQIVDKRVFTGTTGTGAPGPGPTPTPTPTPPPPPVNPNSFYVSATGNDANDGLTPNTPFATLEKAQAAMRADSVRKNTYLRAGSGGSYNRTATILLAGAQDNGLSFAYYPPDGVDTAVLDGGNTLSAFFRIDTSNVTIDGLKMQNFFDFAITDVPGHTTLLSNLVIQNNDIGHNVQTAAFNEAIALDNCPNCLIRHNYVHDVQSQGISLFAFNSGDTLNGSIISDNVVMRAVMGVSDGGGIYVTMRGAGALGGTVQIKNNYVKDCGGPGITQVHSIYLDDDTCNTTVSGNVVGPPAEGTINAGSVNSTAILFHNGKNNVATGNIFDLGDSSFVSGAVWGNDGNAFDQSGSQFISNILTMNFTGSNNTNVGNTGVQFYQNSGTNPTWYTIQNNVYHNYGGGQERTDGQVTGDASPQHFDPKLSDWTYTLDPASAVFSAPVNFPPIVGGWGPPGFSIPQTGARPSHLVTVPGYYVSPTGNDTNDGLSPTTPFQTLEKAQAAMQGQPSTGIKTTYLRGGTYNRGSSLNLGTADNGTTWRFYDLDGANTAILDGANALDTVIHGGGCSNVNINGIKMQNFVSYGVHIQGGASLGFATASGNKVQNCDIGPNTAGATWSQGGIFFESACPSSIISHNYIHDIGSFGIVLTSWFNATESIDNSSIDNNVVLRAIQRQNDGGAIYVGMHGGFQATNVQVKNNYVKDWGTTGITSVAGIYCDDYANHVTVSGNVIGPPGAGVGNSGSFGPMMVENHNGSFNSIQNNIVDLGSSKIAYTVMWFFDGNPLGGTNITGAKFQHNIVISNFAGANNTNAGGAHLGEAYLENSGGAGDYTISNNMYKNYGGGGEATNGDVSSDTAAVHSDPLVSGWTYVVSGSSPALVAPATGISFVDIPRAWGPPGFIIPQNGSPPSCPH